MTEIVSNFQQQSSCVYKWKQNACAGKVLNIYLKFCAEFLEIVQYTVEPLTMDSPHYGNLHIVDWRLRSCITYHSHYFLYIATFI